MSRTASSTENRPPAANSKRESKSKSKRYEISSVYGPSERDRSPKKRQKPPLKNLSPSRLALDATRAGARDQGALVGGKENSFRFPSLSSLLRYLASLERQSRGQLSDPRSRPVKSPRGRNLPEVRTVDVRRSVNDRGLRELRMVQSIEILHPELQTDALCDGRGLGQRDVYVQQVRSAGLFTGSSCGKHGFAPP